MFESWKMGSGGSNGIGSWEMGSEGFFLSPNLDGDRTWPSLTWPNLLMVELESSQTRLSFKTRVLESNYKPDSCPDSKGVRSGLNRVRLNPSFVLYCGAVSN